ncbi:hypothetical protein Scep_023807 [Stephania cephalantha]|uniref:Uncharacterized protein n=1 Tax=Stephania cephalantha TaxID=152367 RepID=A0AAP0HWK8_9MAGN
MRGGGRYRGERGGFERREEGRRSVQRERKMEKIPNSVLVAKKESKPVEEGRRSVQRTERRMGAERIGEVAGSERERKLEKISPSRRWWRGKSRNRRRRWSVQRRCVACRGPSSSKGKERCLVTTFELPLEEASSLVT